MATRNPTTNDEPTIQYPHLRDTLRSTLRALRTAWENGQTDDGDGGVPAAVVADELGSGVSTARDWLRELEGAGIVERRDGLAPDSWRPRVSWAPADAEVQHGD
jgi:hypothetical protein